MYMHLSLCSFSDSYISPMYKDHCKLTKLKVLHVVPYLKKSFDLLTRFFNLHAKRELIMTILLCTLVKGGVAVLCKREVAVDYALESCCVRISCPG